MGVVRMRATSFAIVALTVTSAVLVANSVAVATTGHALIAGTSNSADKTTTLTKTKPGAALSLKSRPGSPALAVSSTTKVLHLNADLVDGYDGARLNNDTYRFTDSDHNDQTSFVSLILPALPAGSYQVAYTMFPENGKTATPADPFQITCYLTTPTDDNAAAGSALTYGETPAVVSGADVITLKPKAHVVFACDAGADEFTVQLLRLSLTKTTVLKNTKLTPRD
jgi:hypothetical protein